MNYGWRNVKGYHDGNYPDELAYGKITNPILTFLMMP